jgi:hypothetical protein
MAEDDKWREWLSLHTSLRGTVDEDFGLAKVAERLGKSEALAVYWEGVAKEDAGDVDGGIVMYRKAFKQWPALDSVSYGGLPKGVREEAESVGYSHGLITIIDVSLAQATEAMVSRELLTIDDIALVELVRVCIAAKESSLLNNPQNATHHNKTATFLNNGPEYSMVQNAPGVVGKMIQFAIRAWEKGGWGEPGRGPLAKLTGGIPSLSIRVIEHWSYSVGGGLVDPLHYDADSVVTIVALLSDSNEFEGGEFRTNECNNTQIDYDMKQGDVICFVSHKYHNITPLTKGIRKSLVIELWEGGTFHAGR